MKHKIRLMDTLERTKILKLIQQEVIPAIGCTEPISVALCTAKATEILGTIPEKITVYLSANILKNAMGVGIPGTGMIGLPIAIALGALIGKSEYQLISCCCWAAPDWGARRSARGAWRRLRRWAGCTPWAAWCRGSGICAARQSSLR